MPFSCRIYGLGVQLDRPIAALEGLPAAKRIEVRIAMGALPGGDDPAGWTPYAQGPSGLSGPDALVTAARHGGSGNYRLAYADGTMFVIDASASRVWGAWPAHFTIEDAATYLLGPVMGFVLRLRGVPCLHASAVAIDGRAALLAAHSGGGKSTTAAAFALQGFRVLGDDVAALECTATGCRVQPAYPRLRLWPPSVRGIFGAENALPPISPTWDKRYLGLGGPDAPFQHEALPLDGVYFLDDRVVARSARFERLDARTGLVWLLGHTYVNYLLDRRMRVQEFDCLARLAQAVPLVRVHPPADISRVDALCAAVVADVRGRRGAPARAAPRSVHVPV